MLTNSLSFQWQQAPGQAFQVRAASAKETLACQDTMQRIGRQKLQNKSQNTSKCKTSDIIYYHIISDIYIIEILWNCVIAASPSWCHDSRIALSLLAYSRLHWVSSGAGTAGGGGSGKPFFACTNFRTLMDLVRALRHFNSSHIISFPPSLSQNWPHFGICVPSQTHQDMHSNPWWIHWPQCNQAQSHPVLHSRRVHE